MSLSIRLGSFLILFVGFFSCGPLPCTSDRMCPSEQLCNLDQGVCVDELGDCELGRVRPCYTGKLATKKRGLCREGLQTCSTGRLWGRCIGEVLPSKEFCNQEDNDCDGLSDNRCQYSAICERSNMSNHLLFKYKRLSRQPEKISFSLKIPSSEKGVTWSEGVGKPEWFFSQKGWLIESCELSESKISCMASKKNRWQGGLQIELRTEFLLKSVGVLRCPMTWKSPVLELRCVEAEKSKVVKQVCCNGNWTDLKVNTLHCGACGKVCKKRDSCVKGTCLRACLATSECPEFSFCRVGFCRSCPSSKYCDQLFSMIPNEQVLGIRIQGFLFSGGGACSPLWAVLKNIARAGHEPKIVWRTYEVHRHFPCEPEKLQSFASRSFPDRTESIISDVSLSGTIYSYRRRYEGFAITINSLGSHQVRTLLNIKGGHRAIPHGIWASQKGFAQFFFGYDLTKSVVLNNKVMKGLDLSRKGFLSILLRVNVDGSYKVGYVFGAEGVAVDPVFVIGDQKGNIFVAAHYNKSFTIEGTKLEYYGKKDLLFAKISPQNKLLWVKALNSRSHVHLAALQIDKSGNFYLAGHFQQKLQLDSHKFSSKGGSDVFVLKLDAKGKLLWGQCFGGIDNEQANDFLLTRKGSLMLLGEFSTQMKLGAYKFSSKGKQDLFLGKFDPNGKLLWWEQAGGSEDDLGASLSLDPQGNLWVTGSFLGGNSRFGHLTGKFSVARKEHAFLWRLQVE